MQNTINFLLTTGALGVPALACYVLGRRLSGNREAPWQTVACFSGLVVSTSLLLLLVAGQIEVLKYGDTQVNRKLREIETLTDQNRRMAQETVEFVTRATSGLFADPESHRPAAVRESAIKLLELSGMSDSDIKKFLNTLNSNTSKTNAP